MANLTPDRLQELRRIAEAATPGPLTIHPCDDARYAAFVDAPHLGPDAPELAVFLIGRDARFFAEFDRDTVLAMLYEIERLRREREVLVEALMPASEALADLDESYYRVARKYPTGYVMGNVSVASLVTAIEATRKALALLEGDGGE